MSSAQDRNHNGAAATTKEDTELEKAAEEDAKTNDVDCEEGFLEKTAVGGNKDDEIGKKKDYTEEELEWFLKEITKSPTKFATAILGITPYPYQVKFLEDPSKRIVVCSGRQVGKTSICAIKALWFALSNRNTVTLIVSKSRNQSIHMFDKILDRVEGSSWLKVCVVRQTRTLIKFSNGSEIHALPCGPKGDTIRSKTAHLLICFPKDIKVTMSDGREVPICKVKTGDEVLSYNVETKSIEAKRVLKTFRRNYGGMLVKIEHENGELVCTPNHQIYVGENKEKIPSLKLNRRQRLWVLNGSRGQAATTVARTVPLRRSSWRFMPEENSKASKELVAINSALVQTSRVCDVQILPSPRFRETTTLGPKFWLGKRNRPLENTVLSNIHKGETDLLSRGQEENHPTMVGQDHKPFCACNLVYGRWQSREQWRNADCNKQLFAGGEFVAHQLAHRKMERQTHRKRGYARARVLSNVSFFRARQVRSPNQRIRHTLDEVQGTARNPRFELPSLRGTLPAGPPTIRNRQVTKIDDVLLFKVQQASGTDEELFGTQHVLCSMWDYVPPAGKPDDLQQDMRSSILSSTKEKSQIQVFNIEVEDNHNYFANGVLVANCDEAKFVPETIITEVALPMLATTNGTMILVSSPNTKNHYFYRMLNSPDWSHYHFKTSDNPTVTKEYLEQAREGIGDAPYRREYEGEYVDDDKVYFPMSLLESVTHSCQVNKNQCIYCKIVRGEINPQNAELYAGYDPGGLSDYAALVIVQRIINEEGKVVFRVVLTKTFRVEKDEKQISKQNGTLSEYYTKYTLQVADIYERRMRFRKILVDSTSLGSPIVSHLASLKLPVEGRTLNVKTKEEIFSNLRLLIEEGKIELPDERELLSHLNCVTIERNRTGNLIFDHGKGTHDDLAYALALAVWTASKGRGIVVMMMKSDDDETPKRSSWRMGMNES